MFQSVRDLDILTIFKTLIAHLSLFSNYFNIFNINFQYITIRFHLCTQLVCKELSEFYCFPFYTMHEILIMCRNS